MRHGDGIDNDKGTQRIAGPIIMTTVPYCYRQTDGRLVIY